MKCVICKQGETRPGVATVALARGTLTMVFKAVPAQVCDNCGEEYLAEDVTTALLEAVDASARSGVEVEVREYARGA